MPTYPPIVNPNDCLAGQAEDKLITYIANDVDFQALYDGEIQNIDPLSIAAGNGQSSDGNITIAIETAGEDDERLTLGLRAVGSRKENYYLLLVVYMASSREPVGKRELMNYTGKLRKIVRRYTKDIVYPGLWDDLEFKSPATTYHVNAGFSRSVSYLVLYGTRNVLD